MSDARATAAVKPATDALVEELRSAGMCPFCGHDPYHYVDIGVGFQAVAVNCCDYGIALFQHGDEQLSKVRARMEQAAARIAADAARIRELEAAGRALLTCPAIADIASEDRDPEDVVAERKMRAALGSRRDG